MVDDRDEFSEVFSEPSISDFAPSPKRALGPLDIRPGFNYLISPLSWYSMFWAFSMGYWQSQYSSLLAVSRSAIFERHEYWRAFTALFTHADLPHLLSNSPLFLIFGWFLQAYFGYAAFPLLTILAGVLTNLVTVYFMAEKTNLVGASGMLYAMVSLWIVLYIRFDTKHSIAMRIFRGVGVSLLLLAPTTFVANVSYLAHGVGFCFGIVFGLLSLPFIRPRPISHVYEH